MNDADHPDDQPAALLAGLLAADRGAAAALLRAALQRPDADAAALAQTLLQQPQAQLRAHGLLAARLAGRADLVLAALTAGDCGIWKATAFHLCQMDLNPDQVAALLRWLLEAAPVQRKYLLTRLAQRRPSALGAELFGALLRDGRPADALRLLRHAGALGDDELAELAREHLTAPQDPRGSVPTWRRQAWRWLAVARPRLGLQLIAELWARVRADWPDADASEGQDGESDFGQRGRGSYSCMHMLRRAITVLLHGAVCSEAAQALLTSQAAYSTAVMKGGSGWPVDNRLMYEFGSPNFERWHARKMVHQLVADSGAPGGACTASARALLQLMAARWRTLEDGLANSAMRLPRLLHRRGALLAVLQLAAGADRPAALNGEPLNNKAAVVLLYCARLAAPDEAGVVALLAGAAAAEIEHSFLKAGHNRCQAPWLSGDLQILTAWPAPVLTAGVQQLLDKGEGGGCVSQVDVYRRLLAYLNWEPEHRAAVLTMPQHLPDPAARASAYRQALRGVPLHSAEAVNDAVAWVLRRTRNERGEVREQVLEWLLCGHYDFRSWSWRQGCTQGSVPLHLLSPEALKQLENALVDALPRSQSGDEVQHLVAGIASEVLRQGVLQPESAWLGAGLRWPAVLLRQLGSRAAAGSQKEWNGTSWWTPKDAFAAAISRDTLQRSSNRQLAVRMLLGELLPLYQSSGHREAARRLVQGLAQTGWQLIIGGPGCESVGSQLCTGQLDSDSLGTLPELADAVQRLLQAQFPASDWPGGSSGGGQSEGGGGGIRGGGSQDVGSSAGDDESSGSEDGTSGAGGIISFRQVCQSKYDLEQLASCITFWLLCGGGHLGLEGQLACAQALLAPSSGNDAAALCFLCSPVSQVLLAANRLPGPAPPVALWWREAVLSSPNLLKHLVKEQPQLCRQLLRRTSGIGPALCDVLVAHQLWLPSLYGVQPRYDAAALAAALAAPEAEREQALIRTAEGYAKPLFQPASGSVREVIFHLKSRPDLRRWPPAVQAQLRQLFTAVARMESAAPVQRKAALCLLARLQDTTVAELEHFASDEELTAMCILLARRLPDKQAATHFLQRWLTTDHAGLACTALRRISACLTDSELQELCADQLSTVGLRAAAWESVVTTLLERGTPQALELVWQEMARPDLTISMRCGLLSLTRTLCQLAPVKRFWGESAAMDDAEVTGAVLQYADAGLMRQSSEVADWWSGLVLQILRTASRDSKLYKEAADQLAAAGLLEDATRPVPIGGLLRGLLDMAAEAPVKARDTAVWLLGKLGLDWRLEHRGGAELEATLRQLLQSVLDRAAAEQQAADAAPPAGPAAASGAEVGQVDRSGSGHSAMALLLSLMQGDILPSPWQLGCSVPPVLLGRLWRPYCRHLARSAINVPRVAAAGGAASLVADLEAALGAAASSSHALLLALELLKRGCPCCKRFSSDSTAVNTAEHEQRATYARAVLQVARQLAAQPSPSGSEAWVTLPAALAALSWVALQDDGEGSSTEAWAAAQADALATLRQLAAGPQGAAISPLFSLHREASSGWGFMCGVAKLEALLGASDGEEADGSEDGYGGGGMRRQSQAAPLARINWL